jgi:YfiH family protein
MGIAPERLVTINQRHTNRVVVIDRPVKDSSIYLAEEADAIITNQPGLAIGVLTADCVPVLLVDAQNRWIDALHCGWKGIHRGIIEETVDCLDKLGSNRGDIRAALGPCLKQRHYEVDEDFMKDITAQDPGCRTLFRRPRGKPGKYLFDCSGYAVRKLKKAGIRNIDLLDFDTFDADLFFSYRRSLLSGEYAGTDAADEGRQMSAIALRD